MFHKMESHWARREYFKHYMDNVRCTYSFTVNIDISKMRHALKFAGYKDYPAQIYLLTTVVNQLPEFRMGLSDKGEPGYWDYLDPAYTIFNPDLKTFSSLWTAYDEHFPRFYQAMISDCNRYRGSEVLSPGGDRPDHSFDISSVPWIDFSSFNLNVYSEGTHLLPVFTIGKYIEQSGRTLMPLALQLHHAACDGYHAGQFIEILRTLVDDCYKWL